MQSIAKLSAFVGAKSPPVPLVPYLILSGPVDIHMTNRVEFLLKKIPSEAKKLAIIVSAREGSYSQAHIISNKLQQAAKKKDLQLISFCHEVAMNSGFMLLMSGNRIYVDSTSIIGGIEQGFSKIINKKLSQFIDIVTYQKHLSAVTEAKKNQPFDPQKAQQLKNIYEGFTQSTANRIKEQRKQKLKSQVDFFTYYQSQEAEDLGLVDGVGRIHEIIPKLVENARIQQLMPSRLDKIKYVLKNLKE